MLELNVLFLEKQLCPDMDHKSLYVDENDKKKAAAEPEETPLGEELSEKHILLAKYKRFRKMVKEADGVIRIYDNPVYHFLWVIAITVKLRNQIVTGLTTLGTGVGASVYASL